MNGKKARAIRREIYGTEYSIRMRRLYVKEKRHGGIQNAPGTHRARYQALKKGAK